jgi:PadR family transcriptional regulator PadR
LLLLKLRGGPAHGYRLLDGLDEFELGHLDPSVVYRTLREMELGGWVASTWDPQKTQGPPRRVYRLSPRGREVLAEWARALESSKAGIDRFLEAYRRAEKNIDESK